MKIALFGTFDVDNYGDLLFPHIATFRYPEHEWTFVSPTNSTTSFLDSKKAINFQEAQKRNFDLIIIGGGNIIHTQPTTLKEYDKVGQFAYPELWIGAAKMAIQKRIPYTFNAPGISYLSASKIDKILFRQVFNLSSYLSFREEFSKLFAQQYTKNQIECIPDTAIEIAKVWPYGQIKKENKLVVNLNQRYHQPVNITAYFIEQIANQLNLDIEIVVIGDCHGDLNFSKKIINLINAKPVKLIEKQSLQSLAKSIAAASLFIGSSMHGFITALSYKTPCLLVLDDKPMHKFTGLIKELNLNTNVICSNWKEALDRLDQPAIIMENDRQIINNKLNKHWSTIIETKQQVIKYKYVSLILLWKHLVELDRRTRRLRQLFINIFFK